MKVLGIDPGSRCLGFGVIEYRQGKSRYLGSGYLALDGELPERLLKIDQGLTQVINKYQPDVMAIEQVFMQRFARSALVLGHARGVAIVAAARRGVAVSEYAARYIKQAVVGYGAAEKGQVQHMVQQLLKLNGIPQADSADALAVAICHSVMNPVV